MNPDAFTLEELVEMADARVKHDWDLMSSLMALLANINRNPKKRAKAFHPREFNPTLHERTGKPAKAPISVLKDVFIDGKQPDHGDC